MGKVVKQVEKKVPTEEYDLSEYDVKKSKRLVLHFTHDIYCPEDYRILKKGEFKKIGATIEKTQTEKINNIYKSIFPASQGFKIGSSFSFDEVKIATVKPKKNMVFV